MTTVEDALETVHRLRDEGHNGMEISRMAGIAKQTVYEMMKSATVDDLRSLRRARKARYYGTCEVCGGHTNKGGNAAPPSTICQECRTWPKDAIIEAIQRWADQHGGIPPTATEWRHSQDGHPCSTAVIKRIGWNKKSISFHVHGHNI